MYAPSVSVNVQTQWQGQPVSFDDRVASTVEYLPFTVRLVQSEADLKKAVQIRHAAYSRHFDAKFIEAMQQPEEMDKAPGVAILLAESKLDGTPLGTMRIQTNRYRPLALEQSLPLPAWMDKQFVAEATRLGVTQEKVGRLVKTLLFKAYYQYCQLNGLRYMVIAARSPVDRQYERLLFQDVYQGMGYVPLVHMLNLPHRILYLDVAGAEALWRSENHPLCAYMLNTSHPDLMLA